MSVKISVLRVLKRSYICYYIICMTVPSIQKIYKQKVIQNTIVRIVLWKKIATKLVLCDLVCFRSAFPDFNLPSLKKFQNYWININNWVAMIIVIMHKPFTITIIIWHFVVGSCMNGRYGALIAIRCTNFTVRTKIILVLVIISRYSRYLVNINWSTTKIKFVRVKLYTEVENSYNTLIMLLSTIFVLINSVDRTVNKACNIKVTRMFNITRFIGFCTIL